MAIRLVLNHPVIQNHFLSGSDDNQSKKICVVVTDCIAKLLSTVVECKIDVAESMDFYQEKTEESLQSGTFQLPAVHLLEILHVLIESCSETKCGKLLALLLQEKYKEENVQEYVTLLVNIMKKLQESSLQQLHLSEVQFSNLVMVFVSAEVESAETLAEFVQKFPTLSVSCTEKCLKRLLNSDLRKSRLLRVLLSNNMTLTLKVMKKIEAGELSPLHENLHLVYTCLQVVSACKSLKGIELFF